MKKPVLERSGGWAGVALLAWAALAPAQGPVRVVTPELRPIAYQVPGPAATGPDTPETVSIQLEPPGLERLSRLDSDPTLQERIRQQNPNEKQAFPDPPILSRDTYAGRGSLWQRRQMTAEPNFVCYGKCQSLFEDKNAERYGWDLGPLSVPVAALKFFAYDTVLSPAHYMADPCRFHECSAGHCLPGDPVPYLLYPPQLTVTGTAAELAVIGALIVVFP